MSKVSSYILNFILFLALVGGVALCSPSIKGFCSEGNVSNQSIKYFTLSRPDPSTYPSDLNYTCEVTFPSSLSFKCAISPSTTTSSLTYYYGVLLHVVTTNGDYVVRVSDGSFSTVPPQPANTKTVNNSLGLTGLGTYTFPGYFIQCYIEYTVDGKIWRTGSNTLSGTLNSNTGSFNGSWQERSGEFPLWSVSSVNGTNVSYTNLQSASGDYMQILTQIYNELLDQGISLDDMYSELLDQGLSLDSLVSDVSLLKQSICYDFPLSIDGNYHLSTCYSNLSVALNSLNLSLGYSAFDVNGVNSGFYFYGRVPQSRKILVLSSGNYVTKSFTDVNGSTINVSTEYSYDFTDGLTYRGAVFVFPDSVSVGSFYKLTCGNFAYNVSTRLALYDYVVSASDILNYMKEQWSQSSPAVSDLGDHSSNTGDMQFDVFETESSYFGDFDSAVSGAGIRGFSFSAFGGMTIFSAIVSSFYDAMPAELALYITAALIVGCIVVFISAVGRVIKKGGSDG